MSISINQHNIEIKNNKEAWGRKPLLRLIYNSFYQEILRYINKNINGEIIEIGSGIGNFKTVCPECIATDIFPNPWIDRVESAYGFSSADNSVSNLVLFDVFHHLAFPGTALGECKRVLVQSGRVIIFEPYISLLGLVVYGIFHHEPLGLFKMINWKAFQKNNLDKEYYAAEGNATRVFGIFSPFKKDIKSDWSIVCQKKYSALSYILSGGFSRPSFYKEKFLPVLKKIEKVLDFLPFIFATRVMIVLEKK